MATAAQIAANRADATSTVIPGEDPEAYQRLADEYYRDLRPAAALERFQVDTLIRSDWQRRRLKRIEANLYRTSSTKAPPPKKSTPPSSATPPPASSCSK